MKKSAARNGEPTFGDLLREWRAARRLSQLELAGEAEVSARHISFLETGRASPSREMIDRLATALEIPLRARNPLLVSAGYAPHYPVRSLQDPALAAARRGIRFLLDAHDPYPAFVVDRLWDVVLSNHPHRLLLDWTLGTSCEETNILRLTLAPDFLKPSIRNWPVVAGFLMRRLGRQLAQPFPDRALEKLYEEVVEYPDVRHAAESLPATEPQSLLVPVEVEAHGRRFSWFSTLASFGAAGDVTLEEVVIESLHPVDDETARNATDLVKTLAKTKPGLVADRL